MPLPAPLSCFGCRHFQVTHDPVWPYACAHFSIRSRRLPAQEVEAASGEPCAAREERDSPRPTPLARPTDRA